MERPRRGYRKVRVDGRVISQAVVIAYGVNVDRRRELLGVDVAETESFESWSTFLKGLLDRGLRGGKRVVSDSHGGLVKSIASASKNPCVSQYTNGMKRFVRCM